LVVMECRFHSLHFSAVLSIHTSAIQTWDYKLIYQCFLFYLLYVSGMKIQPHLHVITPHMVKKSSLVILVLYAQCFIPWSCYLTSPWLNIPVYCHHP
jgi:antibiotic biosynthesis monooxygenase (ABM) superfamily enzyme